jgi:O-antigen/teichoic acid export membrane protein
VTTKYEVAIMLPHEDSDAEQLVFLSLLVAATLSAVLLAVVVLGNAQLTRLLRNPEIGPWLYLIPVTVLFAGVNQTFYYWLNRRQEYREMSRVRVLQSGTSGAVSVGMGLAGLGASGLILGGTAAHTVTMLLTGRRFLARHARFDPLRVRLLAKRYANHPKFLLPSQIISATHEQFTIFFIAALYASTAAGFFSLAYKIAVLPSTLLANAVGEVFRQSAADLHHKEGEFRELFIKTATRVFVLSIIPYAIIFVEAPAIFAFVFGEPWRIAGEYARILAIVFVFVNAVDRTAYVLGATTYIFVWNALRFVTNLIVAAIAYKFHLPILQFLYLFAALKLFLV